MTTMTINGQPYKKTENEKVNIMKGTLHLELGKRWKVIVFCIFYIEMIIVQLPHVLYAKNIQETYLENTE